MGNVHAFNSSCCNAKLLRDESLADYYFGESFTNKGCRVKTNMYMYWCAYNRMYQKSAFHRSTSCETVNSRIRQHLVTSRVEQSLSLLFTTLSLCRRHLSDSRQRSWPRPQKPPTQTNKYVHGVVFDFLCCR